MGFVRRAGRAGAASGAAGDGASEWVRDLGDADPDRRRRAARALGDHPDAAQALTARVGVEPDPAVREALLTSLIALDNDAAVSGLLPWLRRGDAALRNAVLEALQEMTHAVVPHVRWLLADLDPDVRIFALDLLQVLRHPGAAECLEAVVAHDPHLNVCAVAVDRLAELGTPSAIPALRRVAARFGNEPYLQFAADVAIRRIEGGHVR